MNERKKAIIAKNEEFTENETGTEETIFLAIPNKEVKAEYTAYEPWFEQVCPIFERYHGGKVIALDLPDIWVLDFLPMQNI